MGKLSTLASDTVVYGLSTILSRLIGWLMMPLYIRIVSQAAYGTFSYVYSWTAILLVVVTLGFETGYFRFAAPDNRDRLLGSLSRAVFVFGAALLAFAACFPGLSCSLLGFDFGPHSGTYLVLMALIVLLDSYNAIFFAELRYLRRSMAYALLRLGSVLVNVGLTCLFLFWLKGLGGVCGGFFTQVDDIVYMLAANVVGSAVCTLWFVPRIAAVATKGDRALLRRAFIYSIPLVGMGFFGQANTNIEKILIVRLSTDADPLAQLGIYAACYKIGVLMSIFTQSFRMAFEPFFFKENKEKEKSDVYGPALKWFVYFGLVIFAGVLLFLPLLQLFLTPDYRQGLVIIPWILMGQLFFGVYYSLSLWYKVTDRTWWGIVMSCAGLAVNTALNFLLIPVMGYMGAAVSTFCGYLAMMLLSYLLGRIYYPVSYPVARLALVGGAVVAVVMACRLVSDNLAGAWWPLVAVAGMAAVLGIMLAVERINPVAVAGSVVGRFRKRK